MDPGESIRSVFDTGMVKDHTEKLHLYEKSCSHSGFAKAAEYCRRALHEAGFEQIELIEHEADGRTSAFDCTMPPAWDLTGRSVLRIAGENTVLADSGEIPFAVAPWSPPTTQEGVTGELIALFPGETAEVRNKWVLLTVSDGKNPHGEYLEYLRSNGAIGVVAVDFLSGNDYPESVRWFNGTGRFGWYPLAEDKRLPLFAISARQAQMLLSRLESEKIFLHGVVNTRIYSGKICTVTAVIPGRSTVEYALFSHIYEPFAADNAIGFGAICAIGKAIKDVYGTPEHTLRAVFSMELYGFAAFLSENRRASRIAGALNMDAVNHKKQKLLSFMDSPLCAPWFGDWVIPEILQQRLPDTTFVRQPGNLSDDTFAGDLLCGGIPVNWCKNPTGSAHHCGCDDFEPDWQWAADSLPAFAEAIAKMVQFNAADAVNFPGYAAALFEEQCREICRSDITPDEKRLLLKFCHQYLKGKLHSVEKYCNISLDKTALEELFQTKYNTVTGDSFHSAIEAEMAQIIPVRLKATAFSLADIPADERKSFRVPRLLYSLFDGKNTLLEAFKLADWILDTKSSEADMQNEFRRLEYLAKYNYVTLNKQQTVL